jgi:hypothetical protein
VKLRMAEYVAARFLVTATSTKLAPEYFDAHFVISSLYCVSPRNLPISWMSITRSLE